MRKAIVVLGLSLVMVGLLLTAFGTRQVPISQQIQTCVPNGVCEFNVLGTSSYCNVNGVCNGTIALTTPSTRFDFTLNYVGGFLAISGAVGFAFAYPVKRSDTLRSYLIPAIL